MLLEAEIRGKLYRTNTRSNLAAWGEVDPRTGVIPIWTNDGLWFALDMKNGVREIPLLPPEPELTEAQYAAVLHQQADAHVSVSVCYFIGADEGPIKIGHSVNTVDRLKAFQMGCPVRLRVYATAPGGEAREAAYHRQFRERRMHGEWFERCPEILEEIERLTNGAQTLSG